MQVLRVFLPFQENRFIVKASIICTCDEPHPQFQFSPFFSPQAFACLVFPSFGPLKCYCRVKGCRLRTSHEFYHHLTSHIRADRKENKEGTSVSIASTETKCRLPSMNCFLRFLSSLTCDSQVGRHIDSLFRPKPKEGTEHSMGEEYERNEPREIKHKGCKFNFCTQYRMSPRLHIVQNVWTRERKDVDTTNLPVWFCLFDFTGAKE